MSFHSLNRPVLAVVNKLVMNNGLSIPQLGFGTYRLGGDAAESAVRFALECGYRHIDCAKAYGNQLDVGRALRAAMSHRAHGCSGGDKRAASAIAREDLFITSKLWPTDQHPDHVEKACRQTLAELQVDYLDLYLVHWPVCWRHCPRSQFAGDEDKYPTNADGTAAVEASVTLADTWGAMCQLVDLGLVRSIGLSNCNAAQIEQVVHGDNADGIHVPVLNQIECHPACYDTRLIAHHNKHGMLTSAYCPMGTPTRYTPADFVSLLDDIVLQKIAERCGFSVSRLLLNWSVTKNHVVLVRSGNKEHIQSNAKAAQFTLSDHVHTYLNSFSRTTRSFRVMNPTDFTNVRGKPFFDDTNNHSNKHSHTHPAQPASVTFPYEIVQQRNA